MSAYIPYLVVLGVILVFFIVCYLVFRDGGPREDVAKQATDSVANADYYARKRRDYGATYYGAESKTADEVSETTEQELAETFVPLSKEQVGNEFDSALEDSTTTSLGREFAASVKERRLGDDIVSDLDMTKPMLKIPTEPASTMDPDLELTRRIQRVVPAGVEGAEAADDATRVMPVISDSLEKDTKNGYTASDGNHGPALTDLIALGTSHFMNSFGAVSPSTKEQVLDITTTAFERLGITESAELHALLENIVVQEALLCMQKAYATTPTAWMKETAIEAFMDVVQEPKSSTPYLVAFDALRILPHLQLGHFQILALALLLQYSRNSNNYSLEHLQHYVDKYIEPFLSDLPREESMYRQLDYLRCSTAEPERNTFWDIMIHSYPLVFAYAGFDKEELSRALRGQALDGRYVVKSINSPLLKLAVVDEGLATRYFQMAQIDNPEIQQHLLGLATSKPLNFTQADRKRVLEHISPVLPKVADIYDAMPLSHTSLTLLGLYLGRAHVKVTIGEEFDLSPWF